MSNMKDLLNDLENKGYNEDMLGQVLEEEKRLQYEKIYDKGFNQGLYRGLIISMWVVLIVKASYIIWFQ